MTTSGEEPQERPTPPPGSYGEIAPGVPRYGQYAPAGWEPPQEVRDAQKANSPSSALPPAPAYPGFGGKQPGSPALPGTPAGTQLAPPNRVVVATRMIMAAGALQIIALVIWAVAMTTIAGQEVLREAIAQAMATNPDAAAAVTSQQLFITVTAIMAVIQAACAAGYFWIAAKLRRGRNWARTTALVLAIVSILAIPEGGAYSYYSAARIILGLVAVVLLYRPPAKQFFQAHKGRRGAAKR